MHFVQPLQLDVLYSIFSSFGRRSEMISFPEKSFSPPEIELRPRYFFRKYLLEDSPDFVYHENHPEEIISVCRKARVICVDRKAELDTLLVRVEVSPETAPEILYVGSTILTVNFSEFPTLFLSHAVWIMVYAPTLAYV
jgi:hypothetical protein